MFHFSRFIDALIEEFRENVSNWDVEKIVDTAKDKISTKIKSLKRRENEGCIILGGLSKRFKLKSINT